MSPSLQPILLHGKHGPNPPKVAILLNELNVPFTYAATEHEDVKKPAYLAVNPNGRMPAIHDPNNNDLTLWESGAIIEYLLEQYDTTHEFSFEKGTPEYYHAKQWLFFQTTGQGPYFGQFTYFKFSHPEKVASVVKRFLDEVHRVSGVVEGHLQKQEKGADGPWLVGGKYSYADLAWIMWYKFIDDFSSDEEFDMAKYPTMKEWYGKMMAREKVKKIIDGLAPIVRK